MEGTALAEGNPTAMEISPEEVLRMDASATAIGGQAPTGVGPPLPLYGSLPDAGQHGPQEATRSNVMPKPSPSQTVPASKGVTTNGAPS